MISLIVYIYCFIHFGPFQQKVLVVANGGAERKVSSFDLQGKEGRPEEAKINH